MAMIDRPRRAGLLDAALPTERYDLPSHRRPRAWQDEALTAFRKKHRLAEGRYFTFLLYAGVGSGKTIWSALAVSYMLNRKAIDQVIYVCPNRAIRRRVIDEFRGLNIHLTRWDKQRHAGGISDHLNGVILTYSALIRDRGMVAGLCDRARVAVIFDEIHHLGDKLSWCDAAEAAFKGRAACVLGLSGTPFRGDNRKIPFIEFEDKDEGEDKVRRYQADFPYTLGRSIVEGVCRKPVFHWLHGDVKVTFPDKSKAVVDFHQDLPVAVQNRRLNGAVLHGSISRSIALTEVVNFCRRTNRKLIIFVGGDSNRGEEGGGIKDANEYLPMELRNLGYRPEEICPIVSKDDLAAEKIDAFGRGPGKVLVAVNMISEGVDIPELSVALFLTNITARATTIQRIGRIVRGEGEAHVFMFADPRYKEVALGIEAELNYEIDLGRPPAPTNPEAGPSGVKADGEPVAIGLSCHQEGITAGGVHYSEAVRRKYYRVIAEDNLPEGLAFMNVILPLIAKGRYGPIDDAEARGSEAP